MMVEASQPGGRRVPLSLAIGIGVVAVVLALVAGYLLFGNDEVDASVVLEPAGMTGPDPFTESISVGPVTSLPAPVKATTVSVQQALPVDSDTKLLTPSGTTPGLYGGSNDAKVCDPAKMVEFLDAHPDKAAAWAKVLGVTPAGIADYVAKLTPVVLTADTMVTNHGFKNGRATTLTSVLQSGTAVMVDASGVPRVKCNCGNPLTPPQAVALDDAPLTGQGWTGFRTTRVVSVQTATEVDQLTLIDLETGKQFERPIGWSNGPQAYEIVIDLGGSMCDTALSGGLPAPTPLTFLLTSTQILFPGGTVAGTVTAQGDGIVIVIDESGFGYRLEGTGQIGGSISGKASFGFQQDYSCVGSFTATPTENDPLTSLPPVSAPRPGVTTTAPRVTTTTAAPSAAPSSGTARCERGLFEAHAAASKDPADQSTLRLDGFECDGDWAMLGLTWINSSGEVDAETGTVLHWNGTAWEDTDLMPNAAFTGCQDTRIPTKFQVVCISG